MKTNKLLEKIPVFTDRINQYFYVIIGNKQVFLNNISKKEKRKIDRLSENTKYKKSYSQDGEDMLLDSLYEHLPSYKGFYVDIGAHHPTRFSNTQYFYEKGWRGINIDATPNSMKEFFKTRPNDINIECAISDKDEKLRYFCFKESALNSFDQNLSEDRIKKGWELESIIEISTQTINDILERNLSDNQKIDFIDIDIEGMELTILKSFNFDKYAPKYFLLEDLNSVDSDLINIKSELNLFMKHKGYFPILKSKRTFIYAKQE